MSNTPRTDAAEVTMLRLDGDADVVVAAFFARQLERELIAAQSATGATQDAQAIVASCCAAFDCRPSELLGMILKLKGTAPPVEEKAIGHALNTLDIIANWGDEENEWDAVVKYRSVRDRAATLVAILRSDRAQQCEHGKGLTDYCEPCGWKMPTAVRVYVEVKL